MIAALLHAAAALADILARENAALAALDLQAAAALLPDKRAATDALASAHARLAATGAAAPEATARHLHDLAQENRRLLDRAMAVQTRVLDIIAQTAPRASTQAPRYTAAAALAGRTRALPVAIAASA